MSTRMLEAGTSSPICGSSTVFVFIPEDITTIDHIQKPLTGERIRIVTMDADTAIAIGEMLVTEGTRVLSARRREAAKANKKTLPPVPRRSQAERVAFALTMDLADVRAAEYQPGIHSSKIYTFSHDYYTSPNRGDKLPAAFKWEQVFEAYGLPVYRAMPVASP